MRFNQYQAEGGENGPLGGAAVVKNNENNNNNNTWRNL